MSGGVVLLAGGLATPVEPLALALDLDRRGITLRVEGDKLRVVGVDGAKPELSEAETAAIRRWKAHLIALAEYRAPDVGG